ncbi:sialidase family protein [Saccharibacillus sp. CPCC 101409]|uniref:sialidase family protein n=1 Tax=Saccharibacillus sp. CPCC 101409 TaxID=3058041 RepID=UPI0026735A5E|nr:sialidase family protein [Saccharibacillus sp. CPCC 101409]MDO3412460.1 sialidase family protein [Saccharibacillus sp. CPCC 101409]
MLHITAEKQYVFEEERPFRSCHASTVAVLPGGEAICAWFGGTYEKSKDVAIWLSARSGKTWSVPRKAADEDGIAHWNPVLDAAPDGLNLFYKVGHEIVDWHTRIVRSTDGGDTWSQPIELVPGDIGGRGPVRNKPIRLEDGTLLAPSSVEKRDPANPGKEIWEAFADISTDGGTTWTRSAPVPMELERYVGAQEWIARGLIQPSLWSEGGNAVHMLLRSTEGAVFRSDSQDGGRTWSIARATELPNNNSGIDLTRLGGGLLALVYNPVRGYATDSPRTPLVLGFSRDNGETWGDSFVLEDEPGEYSYPAIVSQGNTLFITYTWKRERIAFWRIDVREEENGHEK